MTSTETILPRALLLVLPPTVIVLLCVAITTSTTVHEMASRGIHKHLGSVADQAAVSIAGEFNHVVDSATGLAANDIVINAIIDAETRENHLHLLFASLSIPGAPGARITLADYRGRPIATNGAKVEKPPLSPARTAAMVDGAITVEISAAGLTVGVPVIYGNQAEGLILVEYDRYSLPKFIQVPTDGYEISLRNNAGDILAASLPEFAGVTGGSELWVTNSQSIPAFPSLHVTVGENRAAAFAAVDRQRRFLFFVIAISFVAVVTGIGATAFLVRRPMQDAIDQVSEANRTKSLFLASMSHEIRTPMNGVLGMAGLLDDGTLSDEQRSRVKTIQSSGETLLSLLNDILDLSKIEAGKLELETIDFQVPKICDEISGLWRAQIEARGLEFVCLYRANDLLPLRTDPTRIKQIVFNCISNAQKFTESGKITFRVRQKPLDDGLVETRFEIHDTGIGLDEDTRKKLFENFIQADNSITRRYGGTGLGLAISKNLAEAMGGQIGVDSTPGSGSCFWFTVVCPVGDVRNIDNAENTESIVAPGGDRMLRILIAEDNKVNQAVVRAVIERAGHRCDTVGNGLEAVAAVLRMPYDLVLMDIQMPEMDGMSATRRIRSTESPVAQVPIIALTANAMKGDREQYLDAGMDEYVSKPIDPAQLFAAIRHCCGPDVSVAYQDTATGPADAPADAPAPDPEGPDDVAGDLDALLSEMDQASS